MKDNSERKTLIKRTDNLFKDTTYNHKHKMFLINEGLTHKRLADFFEVKYKPEIYGHNIGDWKLLEWEKLYEGLIKSADINTAYTKLLYYEDCGLIFGLKVDYKFIQSNKTPTISFFMEKHIYDLYSTNSDVKITYDDMCRLITNLGYFIAYTKEVNMNNDMGNQETCIYYSLHPKYIIELTTQIYAGDGIIYHLTTKSAYKKIQQTCLIPRNSGAYIDDYPDRIYFFRKKPLDNFLITIKNFIQSKRDATIKDLEKTIDLYNSGKIPLETLKYKFKHRYDYCDWVILEVDIKKKNSYKKNDITTQYKFFDDPKSPGIFTYENIDPRCISKIGEQHFPHNDPQIETLFSNEIRDLISE